MYERDIAQIDESIEAVTKLKDIYLRFNQTPIKGLEQTQSFFGLMVTACDYLIENSRILRRKLTEI